MLETDPLYRLSPEQKELLWKWRYFLRQHAPQGVSKFLSAVNWLNPYQVCDLRLATCYLCCLLRIIINSFPSSPSLYLPFQLRIIRCRLSCLFAYLFPVLPLCSVYISTTSSGGTDAYCRAGGGGAPAAGRVAAAAPAAGAGAAGPSVPGPQGPPLRHPLPLAADRPRARPLPPPARPGASSDSYG